MKWWKNFISRCLQSNKYGSCGLSKYLCGQRSQTLKKTGYLPCNCRAQARKRAKPGNYPSEVMMQPKIRFNYIHLNSPWMKYWNTRIISWDYFCMAQFIRSSSLVQNVFYVAYTQIIVFFNIGEWIEQSPLYLNFSFWKCSSCVECFSLEVFITWPAPAVRNNPTIIRLHSFLCAHFVALLLPSMLIRAVV